MIDLNTAKKTVYKLIEEVSDEDLDEVIDFISYLKDKKEKEVYSDLSIVSEKTLEFWYNDIDEGVWNNA